MIKHILFNSHFVIRLRVDDFHDEIKKMKTDDEFIKLNINRNRTQSFHDNELKELAKIWVDYI